MPREANCNHGAVRVQSKRIETTRQIVNGHVLRPRNMAFRELEGLTHIHDLEIGMPEHLRNKIVWTDGRDVPERQPPGDVDRVIPG